MSTHCSRALNFYLLMVTRRGMRCKEGFSTPASSIVVTLKIMIILKLSCKNCVVKVKQF